MTTVSNTFFFFFFFPPKLSILPLILRKKKTEFHSTFQINWKLSDRTSLTFHHKNIQNVSLCTILSLFPPGERSSFSHLGQSFPLHSRAHGLSPLIRHHLSSLSLAPLHFTLPAVLHSLSHMLITHNWNGLSGSALIHSAACYPSLKVIFLTKLYTLICHFFSS